MEVKLREVPHFLHPRNDATAPLKRWNTYCETRNPPAYTALNPPCSCNSSWPTGYSWVFDQHLGNRIWWNTFPMLHEHTKRPQPRPLIAMPSEMENSRYGRKVKIVLPDDQCLALQLVHIKIIQLKTVTTNLVRESVGNLPLGLHLKWRLAEWRLGCLTRLLCKAFTYLITYMLDSHRDYAKTDWLMLLP